MSRHCAAAVLAALLAVAGVVAAAEGGIPKHPRELTFRPRRFTPPRAAAFRHQLSSGVRAFLVEDHEFPLIQVSVSVRTGAYLDPPGKTGLAQLTGSLLRSGGTKSRPPAVFDEQAAFLAAQITSAIGNTSGRASLNCLTKDLGSGLELLVDMLRNPGFAGDRLKLTKTQMLQAMQRRNASTASIESREFARLLRGDRHFSTLQETTQSLEAITREDLIEFHRRSYVPANFVIAASGDFETSAMLAKLEEAFGEWPSGKAETAAVPKPEFTPTPGVYLVDKKDVNQGRVRIGHPGVMISNPDHLALELLNGILGGNSFSSRIVERVRSDEGLAYAVGSLFTPGTYYEGLFQVGFQSKSPSVAQAIAIVLEEINRIRDGKVSEEELTTARNHAIEELPLRFSTAGRRAGQFAEDFFDKLPEDYWQKYAERLSAVTAEEIQRVAQKYLHPDKLVILVVGDAEAILRGNPDRPRYSLAKLAGSGGIVRIPLPDPLTMVYPKE